MPIASDFVEYLAKGGYHPRSSSHSDFLSKIIIKDLVRQCPALKRRAADGEIVAKLRHHQQVGHADWVIDIAIGTCAGTPKVPRDASIRMASPILIQIAIELKSIFTEHGKAPLNRLRDFNSFHGYAHQYDPKTVAAGFLVVNASKRFYSPLRDDDDITLHADSRKGARAIGKNAVDKFRSIHLRTSVSDPPGMEAIGVIVVEHDNLTFHPNPGKYAKVHHSTRIADAPPSPALGDPLHYQSMIQRICNAYTERFG